MSGATEQSHFTVHARDGDRIDPNEVIFPIFRTDSQGSLHFLATGFFVTRFGWFVTAKHVVEDVLDEKGDAHSGLCVIQFSENNSYYVRPVAGFACHGLADVAVGVCAPMSHKVTGEPLYNKALTISRMQLVPGMPVWTYAYPGTIVSQGDKQHIQISPNFYVGAVSTYFASGRDRVMLPAPCYQTSIVLHAASSGGPVFGPGGAVVGVNSSGVSEAEDIPFISRIIDALTLGVPDVLFPGEHTPRRVAIEELIDIHYVAVEK